MSFQNNRRSAGTTQAPQQTQGSKALIDGRQIVELAHGRTAGQVFYNSLNGQFENADSPKVLATFMAAVEKIEPLLKAGTITPSQLRQLGVPVGDLVVTLVSFTPSPTKTNHAWRVAFKAAAGKVGTLVDATHTELDGGITLAMTVDAPLQIKAHMEAMIEEARATKQSGGSDFADRWA